MRGRRRGKKSWIRHTNHPCGRKEGGGKAVCGTGERGGCRGYPEGTNCSGVRRGVLPAHILPTHQEPDTHTPSGLALSVWTALPTVFSPPPPLINPQYPRNPRRPNLESVYSDNPDANFALLPPSPSIILACQRHGMTELSTQRLSAHHSAQRFKNIWKPWTVWEYLYSSETLAQNQSGCCIMLGAGSEEEIVFHEQALARRTFVYTPAILSLPKVKWWIQQTHVPFAADVGIFFIPLTTFAACHLALMFSALYQMHAVLEEVLQKHIVRNPIIKL